MSARKTTRGLRFTEALHGWFSMGTDDRRAGFEDGRAAGSSIDCVLTITFEDVDELFLHPDRTPGSISGKVDAPALSPKPLTVNQGEFRLFVRDPARVETWLMKYSMTLLAEEGATFEFRGEKVIHNDRGLDAWEDTTTLFVHIAEAEGPGENEAEGAHGAGIMHMGVGDLARTMGTFRVLREASPVQQAWCIAGYLRLWTRQLVHTYGGLLDEDGRFWGTAESRGLNPNADITSHGRAPNRTIWCGKNSVWHEDRPPGQDAWLRLTQFEGGKKGPVVLAGGFAMSARSFALDTVDKNIVDFLCENGYDVWLLDYRASIDLASSRQEFTIDDIARDDWPTGVAEVRRLTGATSVQVVGHCMGSVTLLMAIADGRVPDVRTAICSQFTLHPLGPPWIRFKTALRGPNLLRFLGVHTVSPDTTATWRNVLLDSVAALVPVPRGERCGSAVCRWINLMFGMTHHHAQLNDETHKGIVEAFGVGNLKTMQQLGLMMTKELAVDHEGEPRYLRHPERFARRIHFVVGNENHLFLPDSTGRTLRWLKEHNPNGPYTSTLFDDYAHLDCFIGRRANEVVFPDILRVLEEPGNGSGGGAGVALAPAPAPSPDADGDQPDVDLTHEHALDEKEPAPPGR